jgi:chromosomal replication initiation ATPase DnaA
MTNEQKLEYILNAVAKAFGITARAIKARTKKDEIVDARQCYYSLCRNLTKCSLREIAEVVNIRESSTINHGIRQVHRVMEKDEELRNTYEGILYSLKVDRVFEDGYKIGAMRPKFPGLALLHVPYPSLMMQS